MFIKFYGRPYLGLSAAGSKPSRTTAVSGTLAETMSRDSADDRLASITDENEELVEKETRGRFRRMCEGYFEKGRPETLH